MKIVTACTRDCFDACSVVAEVAADGTVRLEGNPDHPVTAGVICAKTRRFGRVLHSPNRITAPLVRRGDRFQTIAWEDALDLCAEKIQACWSEPASILHLYSVGSKGLTALTPNWFFGMLGATRALGSVCDTAGNTAVELDCGALDSNDITDLVNARRIVNWGRDLSRSTVHTALFVRQARHRGAEVLTISPGGDGNGIFSDEMVRVRPGTDRFLAAAVIRTLIERGRIDAAVTARTHNWPAFRDVVMARSLEELVAACEVPLTTIERIADFYTAAGPVATIIGVGLQRYWYGGENVRFINALAMLSGNMGIEGGGSYFTIPSARNFNMSWAWAPNEGQRRTFYIPTIGDDILGAADPPVRLIWVNGTNIVNQSPDCHAIARAFAQTDFKIVVDAFMNDTAERADLVLPCALMFEREDIVGSYMHNYVNYAAQVVQPPEGARTDHWIVSEVGKRLAPPIVVPGVDDILRTALDSPYLDVSLEALRERGFARAKRPHVAFAGLHFAHADGLYRFPALLHDEGPLPAGYPLYLLTLVERNELHSQMLPEDHPAQFAAWVAPDCVGLEGLDLERQVYLASPLGRMAVKLEWMASLHPTAVICRRGSWMKLGGGFNQILSAGLTDIGECGPVYSQGVRLEN